MKSVIMASPSLKKYALLLFLVAFSFIGSSAYAGNYIGAEIVIGANSRPHHRPVVVHRQRCHRPPARVVVYEEPCYACYERRPVYYEEYHRSPPCYDDYYESRFYWHRGY